MRTLHLLRHAKSSWEDPLPADRDRPLAPRGLRAARTMAIHVREQGIAADLVICSPATRTRETLELVQVGFPAGRPPLVAYEAAIYGASATGLLTVLRRVEAGIRTVMLVGHQPGIQDLALLLAGSDADRDRLAGKFPTAALATFSIPLPWPELAPGAARLADYVKPRELEDR